MTMDVAQLERRLAGLDTPCLCDAEKALRTNLRVVDPAIRPINLGLQMLGRAHTVSCHEDFLMVIKGLKEASAGDVLVIDSRGSHKALTGGLFVTEARRKGLAGIVIDGNCRDIGTIRKMNVPYYVRGVNCFAGTTEQIYSTQVSINCGGVVVDPGDLVFGDDDGLVVGNDEQFAKLIPLAEQIKASEQRIMDQVANGKSLLGLLNYDEHCANLEAGRPSKLKFLV